MNDERIEWLAAAFDSLDQAGVTVRLHEGIRDLLETWDNESVRQAINKFREGRVIASWSTPPKS